MSTLAEQFEEFLTAIDRIKAECPVDINLQLRVAKSRFANFASDNRATILAALKDVKRLREENAKLLGLLKELDGDAWDAGECWCDFNSAPCSLCRVRAVLSK